MKLKVRVLRQIISMLCAISMSTSVLINSVGAIDTNDAEAAFSMQYMNSLPKPGEVDFDRFSGKYELDKLEKDKYTDTLQNERTYDVKYPKGNKGFKGKKETIDEKKEYEEIKQLVEKLKQKVKDRTPAKDLDDETIQTKILGGQISKHYKMPEEMRLAKAIYRWVAKEISYDDDSLKKARGISLRKPQDALYVFANRTGVCAGKANLINLMMRLAGIPSAVIVSRTHVFNAIYLKDTVNNREGWTLIDSTWAAPDSDMSLQTGQKSKEVVVKNKEQEKINKEQEKINKMIKGTKDMDFRFAETYFAMTDEYADQINDMVCIYDDRWKEMNDVDIEKFNKELERKLKELNNTKSGPNGFKFKKIRVFKDKNGKCLVEYETNVKQDKAEEFYKYVREKHIENEAHNMLEVGADFFNDGFEGVNDEFVKAIKDINKLNNRSKLTISKEYCKEFQILCEDLLKKHKEELINNINILRNYRYDRDNASKQEWEEANRAKDRVQAIINDMNTIIKSGVEMLNSKYQDVVKIKAFKIFWKDNMIDIEDVSEAVSVNMNLDLPFDDAVKAINKRYDWSDMQNFFPGFYDKAISFKEANEDIIDYKAHKFKEIVFGNCFDEDEKNSVFNLQVDGVTYRLDMFSREGELSQFNLIGNEKNPLENVKILPDILNFGVPFTIFEGIKSLTLQGDEEIILNPCYANVERINADKSTRYYADEVALYTRNKDGSVGNIERIFRRSGEFDGIEFRIRYQEIDGKTNIEKVEVYDFYNKHENVKLPKFLTELAKRFNLPINIGYGVESLILENDDCVDLTEAAELKSLDITNSNKYMVENGELYKRDINGKKGDKIKVDKPIQIIDRKVEQQNQQQNNEYQKTLKNIKGI